MNAMPVPHTPVVAHVAESSSGARRSGVILSGLTVLFLAFDAATKIARASFSVAGTVQLGYPASTLVPIGIILLACVIVYVIPRTAPLGAILLTGYLGGAIATHVRVGNPLFTHELAPIYFAAALWGGLYLRDTRVRALVRSAR